MGARHVGFGTETTVGTAVAATRFFEALTESVQRVPNMKAIEVIRSYSPVDVVMLSQVVRGDVEFLATYNSIGMLLKNLIGSVDTTTGGAVSTHTFPSSAGIPSTDRVGLGLTGEFRRDGSLIWKYAGMKATGLTLTVSPDQEAQIGMSFLGMSETTTGTPSTASFAALYPILPSHVIVTFGSTRIAARSLNLTIANPLDEPVLLGSTSLSKEPDRSGVLKVTGTMEALFENFTDFYNQFDGVSVVDIAIRASDTTHSLAVNLNKSRLIQPTPHNNARERLVATIEFESYKDTTSTENIQFILGNDDATP